jgi:hypothetical protein
MVNFVAAFGAHYNLPYSRGPKLLKENSYLRSKLSSLRQGS